VSYCCGENISDLAEQSGATPASVFRWIEEARESINGDSEIVEWMEEAIVDAVGFALSIENIPNTDKEVERKVFEHIEWLQSMFSLKRSDAILNTSHAENPALVTKRVKEISDLLRKSEQQV
jgi:hypothetical protein